MQLIDFDAYSAFYSLFADALYRCTSTSSDATRITLTICALPSIDLQPSVFRLSVADTGPGMTTRELEDFFPMYNKRFDSVLCTGHAMFWSGVVAVETTDVGEDNLRHYEIRMKSKNSGPEVLQFPRSGKLTSLFRGTVISILIEGHIQDFVKFAISLCEKTSMLKLTNVTIDLCLQSVHDLSGQQMIGLTICDSSIRSLVDYASFERLSIGVVEYLSCHKRGFQEGSPADVRFRELVLIGKGQARSADKKWTSDACVVLMDKAMADEVFPNDDLNTSVVTSAYQPSVKRTNHIITSSVAKDVQSLSLALVFLTSLQSVLRVSYFEDGCWTPAPESVLRGLTMVDWSKFGLTMKECRTVELGALAIQFEQPTIRRRKCPPGGEGLVKAAVEASLTELKINLPQLFVSNRAVKLQQIASDLSECIASIVTSSTNENFLEECASIVHLPVTDLNQLETLIRAKMFELITKSDGFLKRNSLADDGSDSEGNNFPEIDEDDEGSLFSDDDDDDEDDDDDDDDDTESF